jgi:hypothetical protein
MLNSLDYSWGNVPNKPGLLIFLLFKFYETESGKYFVQTIHQKEPFLSAFPLLINNAPSLKNGKVVR